jgi:hypothetical protein
MRRKCQRHGCRRFVKPGNERFCSKSCAMTHRRSLETPAQRSALGKFANAKRKPDDFDRLVARCRLEPTFERAIWRGYQYGRSALRSETYRMRRQGRAQKDEAA